MRRGRFGFSFAGGGIPAYRASAPIDIGIDTDAAEDIDDMMALGVAMQRHIEGRANLMFVNVSSDCDSSAPMVRAVLDYYGFTFVPVSAYQGAIGTYPETYSDETRDEFGVVSQSRTAYTDDVIGLRTALAAAPRALTIATTGGLTSMSRLLQSPGDGISALDGDALITAKVTKLVCMAGIYPTSGAGSEYNMNRDPAGSKDVGDNWPTPVIWHGSAIGNTVFSGPPSGTPLTDPIAFAFDAYNTAVPGELVGGKRQSWDPLVVLHAIDGDLDRFNIVGANGTNTIDNADGGNDWDATAGNDSYVGKLRSDEDLGFILDRIVDQLIDGTVDDGSLEDETNAWINLVIGSGGTVSSGRKTLVNDLIVGLKADGIFTKLDRLWLLAGENSHSALRDIVAAMPGGVSSAPTFVADRGYTSAGAGSNVHSGFNPTTALSPKFVRNSATLFGWNNTAGEIAQMMTGRQNDALSLWPAYTDGNFYGSVNAANSNFTNTGGPVGLYSGNRSAAGATQFYKNGASLGTDTTASAAPINDEILLVVSQGARQVSCAGFGQSLNSTEQGNLYTRLRTYMTAVGVP